MAEHSTIDLTRFCSVDPHRTTVITPWSDGEHTIACDGIVLVRVPRRDDIPARDDPPDYRRVLNGAAPFENLQPLPDFALPPLQKCSHCHGSGHDLVCDRCDGSGTIECGECGHESDCEDCHGTGHLNVKPGTDGSLPCGACRGAGTHYPNVSLELAPHLLLAADVVERIRSLPGLRINLDRTSGDDGRPVPFVFDGGDGVVMTLRRPKSVHISLATGAGTPNAPGGRLPAGESPGASEGSSP